MTEMQRGFRCKIDDHFNSASGITVSISATGDSEYDSCCFGVDSSDKLSDESYMVFFNQTTSPNREIILSGSGANTSYSVDLTKLPDKIQKLVFTLSIDGSGVMNQIKQFTVKVSQEGKTLMLNLDGSHFQSERAVIAVEIYRKDVWRLNAVASGFNGGLSELLKHYGGEEVAPAASASSPPAPTKVSLEKRLEKEAPQLVSLAKPLKISLEKHNLTEVIAQVALLIDISGSMSSSFSSGIVQRVIDKIVPLAMQFDDNGEFELWYFGSSCKRMDSVTTKNYQQATLNWKKIMSSCGGGTNLFPAIKEVVEEYKHGNLPAYVLCITDGGTSNGKQVKDLIKSASSYPIFWQFIGIGGSSYGILEDLDTMTGRKVDNANFFALDDIDRIDNAILYSRMLSEFPQWLKEAKRASILT
ncbi:MAG: VWA domain-containing protein [Synergistaceae bacterium]|nr:VWA domain-containing protein [Synergistaceae bacterium]